MNLKSPVLPIIFQPKLNGVSMYKIFPWEDRAFYISGIFKGFYAK